VAAAKLLLANSKVLLMAERNEFNSLAILFRACSYYYLCFCSIITLTAVPFNNVSYSLLLICAGSASATKLSLLFFMSHIALLLICAYSLAIFSARSLAA
jgi:hypothetical protein